MMVPSWLRGPRGAPTREGASRLFARMSRRTRRLDVRTPATRSRAQTQGNRLRGSGIPAWALLCFVGRLATSEVGHGEQSDKAAPDRTLLGPRGPAPNLEG